MRYYILFEQNLFVYFLTGALHGQWNARDMQMFRDAAAGLDRRQAISFPLLVIKIGMT
jgi:hypothetical protein